MFNDISKLATPFRNLLKSKMCFICLLLTIRLHPNFTLSGFNAFKATTAEEIKEKIKETSNIYQESKDSLKILIDKGLEFMPQPAKADYKKIAKDFSEQHENHPLYNYYVLFQQNIKNVQSALNMFLGVENNYIKIFSQLCECLDQARDHDEITVSMKAYSTSVELGRLCTKDQIQEFHEKSLCNWDAGLNTHFDDTKSTMNLFLSKVNFLLNLNLEFDLQKEYCKSYATFLLNHHRFNLLFLENLKKKMQSRK